MSSVIKVENLSKKYVIDHQRQGGYLTFRDAVAEGARALVTRIVHPIRSASGNLTPVAANTEEFWALRDVSFEVKQGDRIGIIGRNGAGKSTLLKILSRITEPTEGFVRIKGRVASLLEVGTGFHPELTGRENIFLNGAILGMPRLEIKKKFDEIVDFAEIERFLDTPVKRYSSGMYVRLAFAVAAHLEPEILIIDEVLAVGDVQFQKKCLGKMEDVSTKEGRTVLFVSHNMQAIRQFCSRALLLNKGVLSKDDKSEDVVIQYLESVQTSEMSTLHDVKEYLSNWPADPVFRLHNFEILQNGKTAENIVNGEPVTIAVEYEVFVETFGLHIYFQLFDTEGTMLIESINNGDSEELPLILPGRYKSQVVIPADFLSPTKYDIRLWAAIANVRTCIPEPVKISLNVEATGRVNRAYPGYVTPAKLSPLFKWIVEAV